MLCCEASAYLHSLGLVSTLVTTVPATGKQLPCLLQYPLLRLVPDYCMYMYVGCIVFPVYLVRPFAWLFYNEN